MTDKKKVGRPKKTTPPRKVLPVYLDAERQRQLKQIVRRNGGARSAAICAAITFHYAHLKREWPDDFS